MYFITDPLFERLIVTERQEELRRIAGDTRLRRELRPRQRRRRRRTSPQIGA